MPDAASLAERAEVMRSIFGSDYEDSDDEGEQDTVTDDSVHHLPCHASSPLAVVVGGCRAVECQMALGMAISPRISRDKKSRRAAAHTLIAIRKCLRAEMGVAQHKQNKRACVR